MAGADDDARQEWRRGYKYILNEMFTGFRSDGLVLRPDEAMDWLRDLLCSVEMPAAQGWQSGVAADMLSTFPADWLREAHRFAVDLLNLFTAGLSGQ
jgi:hypothetical protein